MDGVAKILEVLGQWDVLWVVFAIVLLWQLKKIAPQFLERRHVTVKVGDKEISFQLAAEQINRQLAESVDLREEIRILTRRLEALEVAGGDTRAIAKPAAKALTATPVPREPGTRLRKRVLWVDDRPDNNAFAAEQLRRMGAEVVAVTSTAAAEEQLAKDGYDAIISDQGRREGDAFVPDAGARLLERAKAAGFDGPIIINTTAKNAARNGAELQKLGAELVTASVSELLAHLRLDAGEN